MKLVFRRCVWILTLMFFVPFPANAEASKDQLTAFALCDLKADRRLAVDFVLDTQTRLNAKRYDGIGHARCLKAAALAGSGQFRFNPFFYSGAIAEELLKGRDLSSLEPALAGVTQFIYDGEPTWADFSRSSATREQFERSLTDRRTERLHNLTAECLVRRAPAASRKVIEAPRNSPASIFDELLPSLSACTELSNSQVSASMLRTALPLAYLRLAVAADPTLKEKLYDA